MLCRKELSFSELLAEKLSSLPIWWDNRIVWCKCSDFTCDVISHISVYDMLSKQSSLQPLHEGWHHDKRFLTHRCTSMYSIGIPNLTTRPKVKMKRCISAKACFTNMFSHVKSSDTSVCMTCCQNKTVCSLYMKIGIMTKDTLLIDVQACILLVSQILLQGPKSKWKGAFLQKNVLQIWFHMWNHQTHQYVWHVAKTKQSAAFTWRLASWHYTLPIDVHVCIVLAS